jgi:hypothetical protein
MIESGSAGPETMRALVRDYVYAVHSTYLDHVRHLPPAERAALPLLAATDVTVVAAAVRQLHLVATTESLPDIRGPEVEFVNDYLGSSWTLRFFDATILPELGLLADDDAASVRRALGVSDTIYHLTVAGGGALSVHHGQHAGVALANQHAQVGRDLERLRHALPRRSALVDELAVCVRVGLDRAAALLAAELTDGRVGADSAVSATSSLKAVLSDVAP